MQPLEASDFLTPWISFCIKRYTGHLSHYAWILFPDLFKPFFKTCPPMLYLTDLLISLPPIKVLSTWSAPLFLDLPLCMLITTPSGSERPLPRIPIRYLLSDICVWDPGTHTLQAHRAKIPPSRKLLLHAFDTLFYPQSTDPSASVFREPFASLIQLASPQIEPVYDYFPPADEIHPLLLDHWTIPPLKRSQPPAKVLLTSPRRLRIFWMNKEGNVYASSTIPPKKWFIFWHTAIPHKAFTPWWRLLHRTIGYAEKLHRWSSAKFPSPLCSVCGDSLGTLSHFFVDYTFKSVLWDQILRDAQVREEFLAPDSLWTAISTLTTVDNRNLSKELYTVLGNGIAAIWHYHWYCHFEEKLWEPTEAFNIYLTKARHFRG